MVPGVVLTIPCTDLISPNGEAGPNLNRVAEKADLLYKKLWYAQRILGIRFPVYILVTKCDEIEGFQSFCREIPGRLKNNIFGWSNPYAIDTGYSSEWVNEAFQGLNRELSHSQFEMFTEGIEVRESDGLFLFPNNFQTISEPLQVYLDHLFKQSVYHESFIFRGLFFCGDSGVEQARAAPKKPFFLKDVFEKKIFPEFRLAPAATRTLLSKNRAVLVAQAIVALIVIVGGLGLWGAYKRFQSDKHALQPVLEQIAEDVDQRREDAAATQEGLQLYHLLRQPSTRGHFEQSARHLFKGMTNIRGLKYVFIPSSWFSDIHEKIKDSMTLAYDEIILKAMYIQLLQKAKAIFETAGSSISAGTGGSKMLFAEKTPEFIELRKFVEDLRELEKYAELYNGLRTSKNLADLGSVVKYLFGIDLPAGFYKNAQYYHEALGGIKYRVFDPRIFKIKAKFFTLRKLTQRLYGRLFQSNVVDAYLHALLLQLENFGQESRSSARHGRLIRDLLDTITQTEKTFAEPTLAWISNEAFNLGESFDNILSSVEQSLFLGPDMRLEVQTTGEGAFRKLKDELKQKKTALTGPLLKREGGEAVLMLSQGVLKLKTDLEKLLSQEFMVLEPIKGQKFEIPVGTRLIWDTSLLEEAVRLIQPYEGFIKSGLRNLPVELQNIIKNMAQNSLETKMLDMIARAQNFEPLSDRLSAYSREIALRSEIRNFKEAVKLLNQLLLAFDQLDLVDSYLDLSDLANWQTSTLLEAIDELFMEEDLYSMKRGDFSWWNGEEPVSLAAFGVNGEEELKHYLGLQQARIKHLAYEYAEPVVTFFMNTQFSRTRDNKGILFRWEKILSELDKYENKKPENSITVLEKFILFDINEINKENYFKKITRKDLSEQSGGYFLQKRNRLRQMLFEQCQSLAAKEVFQEYTKVKGFFNRRLAGRFPFSKIEGGRIIFEADPEDIRDFYRVFDEYVKEGKQVLPIQRYFGVSGIKALEFLDQIKAIRGFFAPFLDGIGEDKEKNELPIFDFYVEFRVNKRHETGGNQIIEWKLSVGEQEFQYMGDRKLGRWNFGDPIRFSFRWAKNSVDFPIYVMGHAGVKVEDRAVEYRYDNQWSLIHFLLSHASSPADFDRIVDPKPHTLRFVIETNREGMENPDEGKFETRVFIRLTPLAPDGKKKETLVMPTFFPDMAPELNLKSAKLN